MSKIAILPDTHGRQFWKTVRDHKDEFEKIVFLGDYVSPYPDERITNEAAIEILKEVVEFKKENPDKVVLLLGNHDFSYFNTEICECRTDHRNWNWLNGFYMDNIKLFDLCWEIKIGGKRYFLSHAGVRKGWFDKWVKNDWFKWDSEELPPDWLFNNMLHAAYDDYNQDAADKLEMSIGVYSYFRGWGGADSGSMVWADIREYAKGETLENDYDNVVFICGHTQLQDEPIIKDWVMDLDCRKPFALDTETGKVEEYK
jgi:predicted phosphodiesterase